MSLKLCHACVRIGFLLSMAGLLSACNSTKLVTSSVNYQSIRTVSYKGEAPSEGSEILLDFYISPEGMLSVFIQNLTNTFLVIDQTRSYFIDTNGKSITYYDPTVHSESTTDFSSSTSGVSANLGALGRAMGIGGPLGSLLGGIGISSSSTSGTAISKGTFIADQPQTSLGPNGSGVMPHEFPVTGVGKKTGKFSRTFMDVNPALSPLKFRVTISYSVGDANNFKMLTTDFFVNSQLSQPVPELGRVNEALQELYRQNQYALTEPWWMIYFGNTLTKEPNSYDAFSYGHLINFQ